VSGAVTEAKLWYWQRASAKALALFVLVHLATLVFAVRGGLSAAEILGRTRGSVLFGGFYALFVVAAAMHASIGLAGIAEEWLGLEGRVARLLALGFALLVAATGLCAVYAVVAG
jgi:fumarate reductase subunit C